MFLSLLSVSCFHRANASAGTAVDARTGIDLILSVSLGDGSYGALTGASSTADALIIDYISHSVPPLNNQFKQHVYYSIKFVKNK